MKKQIVLLLLLLVCSLVGCNYTNKKYFTFELDEENNGYIVYAKSIFDIPESIEIPSEYKGKKVIAIGEGAFYNCKEINKVVIPDTVKLIDISAFEDCVELEKITLPKQLERIEDCAFANCNKVTSLHIKNNVNYIHCGAFKYCSNIKSITVDSDNLVYESRNCNAIIEKDTSTLIYGCKTTVIPDTVLSIGAEAFNGCLQLKTINIPSSIGKIVGNPFINCKNLTTITVNEKNTIFDSRNQCNGIVNTSMNTLVTGCKDTKLTNDIHTIGNSAFLGQEEMTSFTISEGVKYISSSAFKNCYKLETISFPSTLISIGTNAFLLCDALKTINGVKNKDLVISTGNESINNLFK